VTERVQADADLVIIGAGPTGMAAAIESCSLGLEVVLLDEQQAVGGQIYRNVEAAPASRLNVLGPDYQAGQSLTAEYRTCGARHIDGAVVWSVSPDGTVEYIAGGNASRVVGRRVLLASGSMERPFPIPGWTLPGVLGAGAAQILLKGSGALPTEPVILAGCGPLLYLLAWQYLRAGVAIRAVVDTTATADYLRAVPHLVGALKGWKDLRKGLDLLSALHRHGVKTYSGCTELAIDGDESAEAIKFRSKGKQVRIPATLILLHHGVVPNTQLSWSVGADHRWSSEQLCWVPITDEWGRIGETALFIAGDSRRIMGALAGAAQGRLAALAIGRQLGVVENLDRRLNAHRHEVEKQTKIRPFLDALYRPKDENRVPPADDTIVCRCEEVTAGQIRKYVKLGCRGPNQTKAFGRCGMGPCQGRLCGLTVTEAIADARGVEPTEVGYYRIRPPIKPVLLGDFTQ
jgi:NADPH-dependent 2,4-dienoyl-CoA reductase/sulfur reductase-like enzyme